jgi:hypothetical protein
MALLRRVLSAALLVAATVATLAAASAQQAGEADVMAAYLFNFTRFVEWPDGTPSASDPFRLCVVADRAMTALIERTMTGEAVKGRPSETAVPASIEDARRCQILFVGRTEMSRARPMVAALREHPVLTVSDATRFAETGGIIEFVRIDEHVRFRVNVEAAKRSRIAISSRLLRVAVDIAGAPK